MESNLKLRKHTSHEILLKLKTSCAPKFISQWLAPSTHLPLISLKKTWHNSINYFYEVKKNYYRNSHVQVCYNN